MKAGPSIELSQDVLNVLVDRTWADRESLRDLRVPESLGQARQDLLFAIRQLTDALSQFPSVLTRPCGGLDGAQEPVRVNEPPAGSRGAHGPEHLTDTRRSVDDAERAPLDPCHEERVVDELIGEEDDRGSIARPHHGADQSAEGSTGSLGGLDEDHVRVMTNTELERVVNGERWGKEVHGRLRGECPRENICEKRRVVPNHEDIDPASAVAFHPQWVRPSLGPLTLRRTALARLGDSSVEQIALQANRHIEARTRSDVHDYV